MEERKKKPKFFRRDWDKKIRLGSKIKKKRKWRAPKGRHNKTRLKIKGHPVGPSKGWRTDKRIRNKIDGFSVIRIENLRELENVKQGGGIIIKKIGAKKRQKIIEKANEKGIKILNRYQKKSGGKNAIS